MDGGKYGISETAHIKKVLGEFILQHTGEDAMSSIDEIVLSYLVGILETMETAAAEDFDIEQFTEMMSAYIPPFSRINSDAIFDWMHGLSRWLARGKDKGVTKSLNITIPEPPEETRDKKTSKSPSPPSTNLAESPLAYDPKLSGQDEQTVALLCEMFPDLSLQEVAHCLAVSLGDCDNAVQLLLSRQQAGTSKTPASRHRDQQLRQQILNRYGYIDQDEDSREHRPMAPKAEPKKLIRYRESKIVSVKGERFSEIKREEPDDLKKTYVTLKPARQYRFH